MAEKVILPADIAQALSDNAGDPILFDIEGMARSGYSSIGKLYDFYKENGEQYFSALVNGYQVEKTPEEKLLEYYRRSCAGVHIDGGYEDGFEDGVVEAVETTLSILGITIEGVNA